MITSGLSYVLKNISTVCFDRNNMSTYFSKFISLLLIVEKENIFFFLFYVQATLNDRNSA